MKAPPPRSKGKTVAAQGSSSTERRAADFRPDRVATAKAEAAVIRLLAKAILESHNKPTDRA